MAHYIDLEKDTCYTFCVTDIYCVGHQSGMTCRFFYHQQELGSLRLHIAPSGLKGSELLSFFDDIELIAVELYDVACEQKKILKQMSQAPFAYLTKFEVTPEYRNQGIGGLMLDHVELVLQTFHISNLYLISVADTKKDQQKLHHFYTNHYFTYLTPTHPEKPAVMHREIELRY